MANFTDDGEMLAALEAEHILHKGLAYNNKKIECVREYAKVRGITVHEVIDQAIRHLINGTAEPEFVGSDNARRLKQLFSRAFSD